MAKRPGKSTTREVDKDDIRRFSSFGDFVAALVADKVVKSKDDLVLNHPELLSPILFDWYRQGQVACLFAMRIAKTPADHRWESAVVQGPPDPNALEPILLAAATTVNAIQLIFPGDGTASQTVSLINALCEHPSWTCHEIPWIPMENPSSLLVGLRWQPAGIEYASWVLGIAPFEPMPFTRRFAEAPFVALVLRPSPPTPWGKGPEGASHLAHMDDGIGDDTALREKYWELTPKHKRALIGADPVSSAKAKVTFSLPDWCREHLTKLRT